MHTCVTYRGNDYMRKIEGGHNISNKHNTQKCQNCNYWRNRLYASSAYNMHMTHKTQYTFNKYFKRKTCGAHNMHNMNKIYNTHNTQNTDIVGEGVGLITCTT